MYNLIIWVYITRCNHFPNSIKPFKILKNNTMIKEFKKIVIKISLFIESTLILYIISS